MDNGFLSLLTNGSNVGRVGPAGRREMAEEKKPEGAPVPDEKEIVDPNEWDLSGVQEPEQTPAVSGETRHQHRSSSHRHHHSSGSSGGRSSQKRKRRKAKSRLRSFMKRHAWALINVLVALVFIGIIAAVVLDGMEKRRDLEDTISLRELEEDVSRLESTVTGDGLTISAPYFDDDPVLICDVAVAYLEGNEERLAVHKENVDPADEERPVTLRFSVSPPSGRTVSGYTVEVSEQKDFSDAVTVELGTLGRSAQLDHLKTNATYHYRITAALSDGAETAVTGSFQTADTPRILSIDGLKNVRDLGAWHTADGGVIRQGLIFRGSEATAVSADSEARAASMAMLGIRTEMDLRSRTEGSDTPIFGEDVAHKYYAVTTADSLFTPDGMAKLGELFSDLAQESAYPVYLHCTDGGERTGAVCCLLEALVGVEREDILREYALTNPYRAEELEGEAAAILDALDAYEGASLADRARGFLMACGTAGDELDAICAILVEG